MIETPDNWHIQAASSRAQAASTPLANARLRPQAICARLETELRHAILEAKRARLDGKAG